MPCFNTFWSDPKPSVIACCREEDGSKYILNVSCCRKHVALITFAFAFEFPYPFALSTKTTILCRTEPVAEMRLKISVLPRKAVLIYHLTVPACSLPAILVHPNHGVGAKLPTLAEVLRVPL